MGCSSTYVSVKSFEGNCSLCRNDTIADIQVGEPLFVRGIHLSHLSFHDIHNTRA